jgi:hypothetical protein
MAALDQPAARHRFEGQSMSALRTHTSNRDQPEERPVRLAVAAVLVTALVSCAPLCPAAGQGSMADTRVQIALEELRQWRLSHGCGETTLLPALMLSARNKALALQQRPSMLHEGSAAYIRQAGYDLRTAFADNPNLTSAGTGEQLADGNVIAGLRIMRTAPYHAFSLLAGGRMHVGMSDIGGRTVLHMGFELPRRIILMPYAEQSDVEPSWRTWSIETPMPLAPHEDRPERRFQQIGPPIGLTVSPDTIVRVERAELWLHRGENDRVAVEYWVNTPATDPALGDTRSVIFLIPKRPLQRNQRYTVEIAWLGAAGRYNRTAPHTERWSFRTRDVRVAPTAAPPRPAARPKQKAPAQRRAPARPTRRTPSR